LRQLGIFTSAEMGSITSAVTNTGEITTTAGGHTVHWAIAHQHRKWLCQGKGMGQWQSAKWPLRLTQQLDQLMRTGQKFL